MAATTQHEDPETGTVYEVRVRGAVSPRAMRWLGDMEVHAREGGDTVLRGVVADGAALYGLVARLRDLGLGLISLVPISGDGAGRGDGGPARRPSGDPGP